MSRPTPHHVCARHGWWRAFLLGAVFLAGCATGGSAQVSGSVYAGVGYNDPWNWGPCCYNETVIVGPPDRPSDGRPPVRPEQPIANPPSSPRPAPMPRPAAGGRRR
jgi:hypothetical protein